MLCGMKFVYDAHSQIAFRHQAARIFDALAWCFSLKSGPSTRLASSRHYHNTSKKLHKDEKNFRIYYNFVANNQKIIFQPL